MHRLKHGIPFFLGGIKISSDFGAEGHSDADVLIHAICDALLGAAGLKDIGYYFPNTDPKYKGIDSKKLLSEVLDKIKSLGYSIGNIDSTITLEHPKLMAYIDQMKDVLSKVLNIDTDQISIKATTNEKLGYVGRGEGINAQAVVLIFKN